MHSKESIGLYENLHEMFKYASDLEFRNKER